VWNIRDVVLLERYLAERRFVDTAKVAVEILVIAHNGYHGGVVGGEPELRDIDFPAVTLGA